MKNVRLVLGSGGARGMAHIGVIEELEREGFTIKEVVGSSMGAVVGGIYCAGHLDDYAKWLLGLNKLEVFKLFDFAFSAHGFVKGEKVFKVIEQLIGDHQIESFKIPFTAVASDVMSKKEIQYTHGSLFKALRASVAIPTVFTPVIEGRSQLIDGGVLNPLPLNLVKPEPGDLVIAVNLNGSSIVRKKVADGEEIKEKAAYQRMLEAFRSRVLKLDNKPEEKVEMFGLFDLLAKSFDMMQDRMTELMISLYPPHIVVNICRESCGVFEFYRGQEIIELGRVAFRESFEQFKRDEMQKQAD